MTRCSGNCCNRANSATKRSAASWRHCVHPSAQLLQEQQVLRRDHEALVDATRIITSERDSLRQRAAELEAANHRLVVGSRSGAVALGSAYLVLPVSSGSASLAEP